MKAGLNLYSVRTLLETEEGFLDTAHKLRDMGYSYLQVSGVKYDPEMIKRVSDASGLPVYLTHVSLNRIVDDTEKLMEEHEIFGCKNIGLGSIKQDIIVDEYALKKNIEQINLAAEKMSKNGFSFFCHHHHYEFYRHAGETVFDYILKNAPYINFTLDTYWMQYGGVNVLEFLKKMKGRIGCVHLKDYKIALKEIDGKTKAEPRFAALGDGTMDMKKIIAALGDLGTEYYLVEQDDACDYECPFGEVEKSANYLKKEI